MDTRADMAGAIAEIAARRFDPGRFGPSEAEAFRSLVLGNYRERGRSFPWRETRDPWAILVSEFMLQQTQTERVLPKYLAWMERFPGPAELAAAPLAQTLALWSGLGYNRRALALGASARAILALGGRVPSDEESLRALPGVGPYTARAVLSFAFGAPVVLVETNVRSVFLHHFFPGEAGIPDKRLEPLAAAALDRSDPRAWHYALMDYGVALKKVFGNPNRRSAHYARQTPFADSNRRIRGAILRELGARGGFGLGIDDLATVLPFSRERVVSALAELAAEGFVEYISGSLRIHR
jgi:A/G-specific adenine glycosylase